MTQQSSAISPLSGPVLSGSGPGWGLVGVVAFSFTVPLTRVATQDGLTPLFVGAGRGVVAAALAAVCLWVTRQAAPSRQQWLRLGLVAVGVVVGFPLLTSYALTRAPAAHGAVVIGLLPAATAAVAVLRTRDQVRPSFWAYAAIGAFLVGLFAATGGDGFGQVGWPDLLLIAAVAAASVGYAEGGLLAREIGAWQTVSWALLLAAPLMVALTVTAVLRQTPTGNPTQWAGFAYLCLVSMYLGFFAWYRGLAIGPMAHVSQIQLVQPVLSLAWAALLLGEHLDLPTVLAGVGVIGCAAAAVRTRLGDRPATRPAS